jgi:hypothetical protein
MNHKVLAENQFGHGANVRSSFHHWINRIKRSKAVKSGQPFNWSVGVTGRPTYDIKNQFQSDSCGGQALSRALQIILGGEDLSAKSFYSQCYSTGGGVATADVNRQLLKVGITTEANVPSLIEGFITEAQMEDVSWRTSALIQDCLTRAGFTLLTVDIDPDSMADAIQQYGCVVMIIQGQNNGTWLSANPQPPVNNNNLWAHFMCSTSNIQPQQGTTNVDFYQSWGNGVGNNGIQTFGQKYINSGYIKDVFAVVPFQFTSNLSLGSMGVQVSQLQEMLRKTGDFTYPTDTDFFGIMTMNALIKYQKRNNITPAIGYFGSISRASLNQMLATLQGK